LAHKHQIPILSHDDDTVLKVDLVNELGTSASEFPVTLEAAKAAKAKNMFIFMGAPNLLRNCSSNGNLRSADIIVVDVSGQWAKVEQTWVNGCRVYQNH